MNNSQYTSSYFFIFFFNLNLADSLQALPSFFEDIICGIFIFSHRNSLNMKSPNQDKKEATCMCEFNIMFLYFGCVMSYPRLENKITSYYIATSQSMVLSCILVFFFFFLQKCFILRQVENDNERVKWIWTQPTTLIKFI